MVRGTSWAGMDESRSPVNRKICNIALGQLRLFFNTVLLFFHTSFALDPHLYYTCTFGGLVYHPIPHRKVPSMGGCLFILVIMGFCVYGWYLHTQTPVGWYLRGRRRLPRRAYVNRRISAGNRKRLAIAIGANRRRILRLASTMNGNRQPYDDGETSG